MPPGASAPAPAGVDVRPVRLSRAAFVRAAARAALAGDPLQSALSAGPWRRVLSELSGRYDLVIALLSRLWPELRGALPLAPLLFDHVDALGAAAEQAARRDPSFLRRLYWKLDAPRLRKTEREIARHATLELATTPFDAAALGPSARALAIGVALRDAAHAPRGLVVTFSGRLGYRPNALAAERLVTRIWPVVRALVPEAELRLGGADAPARLHRLSGRGGVTVVSPVADMSAFLREARVAALPVELGTGTPCKLFEAFEAGAAVVASPEVAARGTLDGIPPPCRVASSDAECADAIAAFLLDAPAARAAGEAGRRFVEARADRARLAERLAALHAEVAARGEAASPPGRTE